MIDPSVVDKPPAQDEIMYEETDPRVKPSRARVDFFARAERASALRKRFFRADDYGDHCWCGPCGSCGEQPTPLHSAHPSSATRLRLPPAACRTKRPSRNSFLPPAAFQARACACTSSSKTQVSNIKIFLFLNIGKLLENITKAGLWE